MSYNVYCANLPLLICAYSSVSSELVKSIFRVIPWVVTSVLWVALPSALSSTLSAAFNAISSLSLSINCTTLVLALSMCSFKYNCTLGFAKFSVAMTEAVLGVSGLFSFPYVLSTAFVPDSLGLFMSSSAKAFCFLVSLGAVFIVLYILYCVE